MKKFFVLMMTVLCINCIFANEHEPEKIFTETDAEVLMYFEKFEDTEELGVTAVQSNVFPGSKPGSDLIIRCQDKNKKFKITRIEASIMVQALDSAEKETSYLFTKYKVKKSSLSKLNKLIKNNSVKLTTLFENISDKDLNGETFGTPEAPDPATFSKLRMLNVYDIYVRANKSKSEIHLQLYLEDFQDSKELQY